jgi:hypothetical protein
MNLEATPLLEESQAAQKRGFLLDLDPIRGLRGFHLGKMLSFPQLRFQEWVLMTMWSVGLTTTLDLWLTKPG